MPRTTIAIACGVLFALLICTEASGLSAVIELNEPTWYTGYQKDTNYGGTSLNSFYAPLPVFFEGWKSEPRDEIVEYTWDFGDGSDGFSGFNATHVYETPGVYTATLTVTDENGATASTTMPITVLERNGTTYYVDSQLGNDANAGTGQGAQAWKTATHAFLGMTNKRYAPGDRILFKRGQTFDCLDMQNAGVVVGHRQAGYGYMFGAYGTGDKPVIQAIGPGNGTFFNVTGIGTCFISFVDLHFECTPAGSEPNSLWYGPGGGISLLFLRVDLRNFKDGWVFPCPYDGGGVMSGLFIIDSSTYLSKVTHMYATAFRVALLNNNFDFSNNHIAYLENVINGVVDGNTFSRVAFGRTALRVSGSDLEHMASNLWVSNNEFLGWIDPVADGGAHNGGGTNYNYLLVNFGPNKAEPRFGEWLVFENNLVTDSLVLMCVAGWEHVRIRNNHFTTPDATQADKFFLGINVLWDLRPLYDVDVIDNTFDYTGVTPYDCGMIALWPYLGPDYPDRNVHEDIVIARNVFRLADTNVRVLSVPAEPAQFAGVKTENNIIYAASESSTVYEHRTDPMAYYTLDGWRSLTGNDQSTQIYTNPDWPVPGWAKAPESDVDSPIPVTYDRVEVTSGGSLSEVALWARRDEGPWADTGLRTSGTSGSFSYPAAGGAGTYYFATQAVDSEGNASLPPVGPGAAKTFYTGGAPIDTTPPNPGTLSAPASTAASPITVMYSGAADEGGSGLKEVELWVKKASVGTWGPTGLKQTGASGSFDYPVGMAGPETFYFDLRAEDNVGNISPLPTGDGKATTVFNDTPADMIPPTTGAINVPAVTKTSPISVVYAGVADEGGSGLKQVVLWAKVNGGSWLSTGQTSTQASGSFPYTPAAGDGPYAFALRAEDNAGNLSAVPSGAGAPCLFDSTAPSVGTVLSPQFAKATPIAVTYSGVSDGTGSGLKKVYLWFRKDGGAWLDSGQSTTTASGTFNSGPGQNGVYEYALRVEDNAGNLSPQPSGAGQTATVYDSVVPTLGTLNAPAQESGPPISVVYSGVQDDRSGLKTVYLWFKKGAGGTWQNSGLSAAAASGSFPFAGMTGDDTYYFALRADDNAGNLTAAPSGDGSASTVYDTHFNPGTAASPEYATAAPITVTYSGAQDTVSGIKLVRLWFKKGATGTWTDSGITSPGESGSFSFAGVSGDATYFFATQAENNNGDLTSEPPYGDGDTQTIFDTTPPDPGSMASPEYTREAPIAITYTGANDAGSGLKEVRLWYKKGYSGAWTNTGDTRTTPDGSFTFNQVTGDDAYFFFLQAEDNAGHVSDPPSDALVFGGG